MLFLAAGLLEKMICEMGLVNVYIFQQPIETGQFQNNADERKGSKD